MRRAAPIRRRTRSWVTAVTVPALCVAALAAVAGVAGGRGVSGTAVVRASTGDRVTRSFAGAQATVSADGALIAYATQTATGTGAGSGAGGVSILDRRTDTTTVLIAGATGPADAADAADAAGTADTADPVPVVPVSAWPTVSADGCTVTVVTELPLDTFHDDDTADRFDVYQQRLPECGGVLGTWDLVSVALDDSGQVSSAGAGAGTGAGDDVRADRAPAVSADGTLVAYERRSATAAGVVLVDLTRAPGTSGRVRFVIGAQQPALSADGSTLAYVLGDAVNVASITAGVALAPQQVAPHGSDPALSTDGDTLAFVSDDSRLVPTAVLPECVPRCVQQVYVRDLPTGVVTLASRVPGDPLAAPIGADADALQPALGTGDDGVLFVTRATNLFPARNAEFGAPDEGDVVLAAPAAGTAVRVSTLADGLTAAPATNTGASLTPTGRVVVFDHRDPSTGHRVVEVVDVAPHLDLADLDVGTAAVGKSGPEWFVQVANGGPSAFVPHTVSIDDANFEITGGTCLALVDRPVAPGSSCSVLLRMTPLSKGVHTAVLTVAEAGDASVGGVAVTVSSQVSGIGGVPAIETLPGGGDAGVVRVGTVGEGLQFDVVDVGASVVTVTSVTVDGEQALDFVIVTDECTNVELRAMDRCSVTVAFAPGLAGGTGRRTATVTVATDAGTYASFLVSGTAYYAPVLTASVDPVLTGSRFVVSGAGFSPATAVTVAWADGSGLTTTVFSDETGAWSATVLVRATDRVGHRTVVAQTIDGQVASLPVQVAPAFQRRTPNTPTWPTP